MHEYSIRHYQAPPAGPTLPAREFGVAASFLQLLCCFTETHTGAHGHSRRHVHAPLQARVCAPLHRGSSCSGKQDGLQMMRSFWKQIQVRHDVTEAPSRGGNSRDGLTHFCRSAGDSRPGSHLQIPMTAGAVPAIWAPLPSQGEGAGEGLLQREAWI